MMEIKTGKRKDRAVIRREGYKEGIIVLYTSRFMHFKFKLKSQFFSIPWEFKYCRFTGLNLEEVCTEMGEGHYCLWWLGVLSSHYPIKGGVMSYVAALSAGPHCSPLLQWVGQTHYRGVVYLTNTRKHTSTYTRTHWAQSCTKWYIYTGASQKVKISLKLD